MQCSTRKRALGKETCIHVYNGEALEKIKQMINK